MTFAKTQKLATAGLMVLAAVSFVVAADSAWAASRKTKRSCEKACEAANQVCLKKAGSAFANMCTTATVQCKKTGYFTIAGYANEKANCKPGV